jgi:hypothetical protein
MINLPLLLLYPLIISAHQITVPCPSRFQNLNVPQHCFILNPPLPSTVPIFTTTTFESYTVFHRAEIVSPETHATQLYTPNVADERGHRLHTVIAKYNENDITVMARLGNSIANSNTATQGELGSLEELEERNKGHQYMHENTLIYRTFTGKIEQVYQMRPQDFGRVGKIEFFRIPTYQESWSERLDNWWNSKNHVAVEWEIEAPLQWSLAQLNIVRTNRETKDASWRRHHAQKNVCAFKNIILADVLAAKTTRDAEIARMKIDSSEKDKMYNRADEAVRILSMSAVKYDQLRETGFNFPEELEYWMTIRPFRTLL